MDEARRVALECAARHAHAGEPALTTVARAEIFLNWLERQELSQPRASDCDLGTADQSPARFEFTPDGKVFAIIGDGPNVYEVGRNATYAQCPIGTGGPHDLVVRDPDNIPTRLVRRSHTEVVDTLGD